MHLWDWRTGYNFQRVHAAVQPGSLDSESGIFACAFDQSESRLLTAEADKTIKVYREDDTAVSSLLHIHFKVKSAIPTLLVFSHFKLLKLSEGKIIFITLKYFSFQIVSAHRFLYWFHCCQQIDVLILFPLSLFQLLGKSCTKKSHK